MATAAEATNQTYTQGVTTVPAQQVNDTVQQLMNGVALTPQVAQGYNQAYEQAGQAQANIANPETRQATLDATGMPQLQNNYAQLAQQLAGYDQAILKPQFEGQNPGQASDVPMGLFGRTPELTMLTPQSAALPASQGIYNANPQYAFDAQNTQANNILALLGTLSDAMGKEYQRGKAQYSTKTGDIAKTLDTLGFIIGKNTDLEMKRADRGTGQGKQRRSDFQDDATTYGKMIDAGLIEWGQAWNQLKTAYPELSNDEIDLELGGSAKIKGKETGRAKPGYFQKTGKGTTTDLYKQERTTRTLQSVDELKEQVGDFTVGPLGWVSSNIPGTPALSFAAQVDTLKSSIISNELQAMREASSTGGALGQVSNRENEILASSIGALDIRQSPKDFKKQLQKIRDSIERWNKVANELGGTNSDNEGSAKIRVRNKQTGQTGTLLEKDFNQDKYERI